ncbi:MAG: alpha/beta fold hydrolase [Saprospiraceae bacterium]
MKLKRFFLYTALVLVGLTTFVFLNREILARRIIFQTSYKYIKTDTFSKYVVHKKEYFVPCEYDSVHVLKLMVDSSKGTILYNHGNRGSIQKWGPVASQFTKYGYNVVVWDYRGYGRSSGKPTEKNILSDGKIILHHLIKEDSLQNIIVMGRSLGSGVATYLSNEKNVTKIILESPYFDLSDVIKYQVPFMGKFIELNILSYEFIGNFKKPVIILHGKMDKVIPFSSGKKLFLHIKNKDKKMIEFDQGNHNNLSEYKIYWDSIESLLNA